MNRQRFEYRVVSRSSSMTEDELNDFGEDGWELVAVADVAVGPAGRTYFYFKRPENID